MWPALEDVLHDVVAVGVLGALYHVLQHSRQQSVPATSLQNVRHNRLSGLATALSLQDGTHCLMSESLLQRHCDMCDDLSSREMLFDDDTPQTLKKADGLFRGRG